jgi:hypothetical protein
VTGVRQEQDVNVAGPMDGDKHIRLGNILQLHLKVVGEKAKRQHLMEFGISEIKLLTSLSFHSSSHFPQANNYR